MDPFALYDNIPQPEYLEIKNYDDQMQDFEKFAGGKKSVLGGGIRETTRNPDLR